MVIFKLVGFVSFGWLICFVSIGRLIDSASCALCVVVCAGAIGWGSTWC